ncbi:DUF4082 domain-containing protein [Chroococcidiopsis sp. FACHB-1243]|uniref:DUF4082 domain-containing protein n=1 Tax=Chroococcidiopsis sp. [FACHB-1243] TaxID=2692781 RepID=UPI00177B9C01|nr:DUF4082 domain-containing protein [Chroococcidiopsis sp. [FACHB-1243]]MBD2308313.1 DUF4082 domain-containing protein [Chroococcidiopsis sp. [FACHB-1243]]
MKKRLIRFIAIASAAMFLVLGLDVGSRLQVQSAIAADICAAPTNAIVAENCLTGNPSTEWDISGVGDTSIQGFASDMSVNRGETVNFKIKTNATSYRLDIYRMGYYRGMGARKVTTVQVLNRPQSQPNCLTDAATGLLDCGNWAVSASWAIPTNAVSGIYFAKLARTDTGGASHIVLIVRDDTSTSDLLFQTADTTWQAYNNYGGNSLYTGSPVGRAYKVSYNRPFNTRVIDGGQDWLFATEYPMVRWLEANGYNVSYFTGVDSDRYGSLIRNHKIFLSVGHDEYWSAGQRANVEAARDRGVNLAFFSGNEVYWKTRWENAIDGSGTSYRTLVTYKETVANAKIDPQTSTWTGTWRDPRFSPPADGGRPENALTGTLFTVNDGATTAIKVPEADGKMRLWRNTSVATLSPGSTATLSDRTLGYEWDEDIDNGFRPAGLIRLSTTTVDNAPVLQDYGSRFGRARATHHLTLYKHNSGALVFGAGTVQWSWGLDGNHDRGSSVPDVRMQQATVNLFADMGVQPHTLQAGLVLATASTDITAPTSTISSLPSVSVQAGSPVTISGTASDPGGVVGGVEVSVDGGTTWHPATGRTNWSYTWTPQATGSVIIKSHAIDDSGNLETSGASTTVTVGERTCPCSTWNDTATPTTASAPDAQAVELGVKFKSDLNGYVTGIRFYKGSGNTGTHVGNLWTSTGQLLATATFSNETATGWQQVNFSQPVAINANTIYVASYHTSSGRYAINEGYFTSSIDSPPLHFLRDGESGGNGVYKYGTTGFPTNTYRASNYWVDVTFTTNATNPTPPVTDTTSPRISVVSPSNGATNVSTSTSLTATFSEAIDPATINANTFVLQDANNALVVPATVTYNAATRTATLQPSNSLATGATYRATLRGGTTQPRVQDLAGNALATNSTWSFTTAAAASTSAYSIWSSNAMPIVVADSDTAAVELGIKFRTDVSGFITGIRFYKGTGNTGVHTGNLWTSSGQQLATATFTNETASGWQQVNFDRPVAITANTVYVASYHTNVGRYSSDENYFAVSGADNGPLHFLVNGASGGNGVYKYGSSGFPNQTYKASNYWVDVVFTPNN